MFGEIGSTDFVPYKPQLTVDVPRESSIPSSQATTPGVAQTPHVSTNIFVAGLPPHWEEAELMNHYKRFGTILSTKVVKKKHFGFVMFRQPEDAHTAINETHLTRPDPNFSTVLHVSIAMHDEGVDEEPNERLFVRGLPQWATKDHLKLAFGRFGNIVDSAVLMNPLGQCKGSGFVQFSSLDEATSAINSKEDIRIEKWNQALEIKFSEKPEVRQLRQERNKNRQKSSPKFRNNHSNTSQNQYNNSSMPFNATVSPNFLQQNFNQPSPVLPSPQNFAMMNSMPYPILCSTSLPNTPMVNQMYTPQPYPMFSPQYVFVSQNSPQKGDIHLVGGPLSEEIARTLIQPFGLIDYVVPPDSVRNGFIVRMKDPSLHATVAQQLNGTYFSSGQLLSASLYI